MKIKIAVAVYDSVQNKRTHYTIKTYDSLMKTVNFNTTEIYFINNDSCKKTVDFMKSIDNKNSVTVIHNKTNVGTAEAINKVIKLREEGDYIVKCDNDVTFAQYGWADKMAECLQRDEKLGILGLKRPDLPNSPWHENYTTKLKMLPHKEGETWLMVEECGDIIGTCLMFQPKLLDQVGYLYQPGVYAFDDNLMCTRSIYAGYYNAFLPSIDIQHIDDGKSVFCEWKKKQAAFYLGKIKKIEESMQNGENPMMRHDNPLYYEPKE